MLTKFRSLLGISHHELVFMRRIEALANSISPLLSSGRVLDVGCGNGMLGAFIMQRRDDVDIVGIDVHLRPRTHIPVKKYDGSRIPFDDSEFDSVMAVDVLHHIDQPEKTIAECLRVTRGTVVIKDHLYANPIDYVLLCAMDWVGNVPHGVRLPYNYFSRQKWTAYLEKCGAEEICRQEYVEGLYSAPLQWFIGRRIQMVSQIKNGTTA